MQISQQKFRKRLKTSKGEKVAYLRFCAFAFEKKKIKKSLYNGNVDSTKLVKVLSALYKQKLIY